MLKLLFLSHTIWTQTFFFHKELKVRFFKNSFLIFRVEVSFLFDFWGWGKIIFFATCQSKKYRLGQIFFSQKQRQARLFLQKVFQSLRPDNEMVAPLIGTQSLTSVHRGFITHKSSTPPYVISFTKCAGEDVLGTVLRCHEVLCCESRKLPVASTRLGVRDSSAELGSTVAVSFASACCFCYCSVSSAVLQRKVAGAPMEKWLTIGLLSVRGSHPNIHRPIYGWPSRKECMSAGSKVGTTPAYSQIRMYWCTSTLWLE